MMSNIFCYPFKVNNNKYIEIQKNIFKSLKFKVIPVRDINILSIISRSKNVAVINWLEDGIVDRNGAGGISLYLLIQRLVLFVILRIMCKKIVWVRHNYMPHKVTGELPLTYIYFCKFIYRLSDVCVSHAPTTDEYKSVVIDHPLYENKSEKADSYIDFLIIGGINEYKKIDCFLELWPSELPLTIAGLCRSKELENRIHEIIKNRSLSVIWNNSFLSDDEVDCYLNQARVVILPHDNGRMIVSGVFYHAISFGCSIIMRPGVGFNYLKSWFSFVESYNDENLLAVCSSALKDNNPDKIINEANNKCANDVLIFKWKNVLS
jgi:hypothetical protein